MDNAEEIMHCLEEFSKLKPKDIPRELEDYLGYVAKTGDPVFKWSIIKCLFREKMLNVITDFYESTLSIELPPCPNVDPFNYERMKANLLEKLDSFSGAPFTVQRISELLTNPWKEYNRADKFMRAIEKNILVVSTREPGRFAENELDSQQDSSFNGIPGPNEPGIESPFTCNETPDPDSSSQTYEVNSESQSTLISGSTSNNISSASFKESVGSIGDSASSNELGIISNDEVSQEIIIEEKDTETVICSTVNGPPAEDGESSCESVLPSSDNKATDLTSENEINSSDKVTDEPKEAVIVEVSGVEVAECSQVDAEEKKLSLTDDSSTTECIEVVSGSQENSEDGSESNTPATFDESRPTECEANNSLDSEASNSCDSEVEVKQQTDEQLGTDENNKMDTSEVNEAISTCSYEVSETKNEEESPQSAELSTSTSTCEEQMDVDIPCSQSAAEFQISIVDQSQS